MYVLVYTDLVFVDVPVVGVLCDPEEEMNSVPRVVPFIVEDECTLGVEVLVAADTDLVVTSEEKMATDADGVMIVVTDVPT